MDKDMAQDGPDRARARGEWAVGRIEIRSPLTVSSWPMARVELVHPERGRVSDIASAPGTFGAAFAAAGHILGISPRLLSYNAHSAGGGTDGALVVRVEIELEIDGRCCRGSSLGRDLAHTSLAAWLDAASGASCGEAGRNSLARPYQVCGVDENGDLWLFASEDEGACEAIAQEFREEGYSELRAHSAGG